MNRIETTNITTLIRKIERDYFELKKKVNDLNQRIPNVEFEISSLKGKFDNQSNIPLYTYYSYNSKKSDTSKNTAGLENYALKVHGHSEYASNGHNHDDVYAKLGELNKYVLNDDLNGVLEATLDSYPKKDDLNVYAKTDLLSKYTLLDTFNGHNHDDVYAKVGDFNEFKDVFNNHDHNDVYAKVGDLNEFKDTFNGHNHDDVYAKKGDLESYAKKGDMNEALKSYALKEDTETKIGEIESSIGSINSSIEGISTSLNSLDTSKINGLRQYIIDVINEMNNQ